MAADVKISVIIPVYNAGRHLHACLKTVLAQTIREIEVICVDDGSTDLSPKIIAACAAADRRVRAMRQEHAGAAAARNRALDSATGEFICFMNADDMYPSETSLAALYGAVTESGRDIAGGRMEIFGDDRREVARQSAVWRRCRYPDAIGDVDYASYQAPWGCTLYIYRRALIETNGLRFPPYCHFQDPPFFVRAMLAAGVFRAIPDVVYRYRADRKRKDWAEIGFRAYRDTVHAYLDLLEIADRHDMRRLIVRVAKQTAKACATPRKFNAARTYLRGIIRLLIRTRRIDENLREKLIRRFFTKFADGRRRLKFLGGATYFFWRIKARLRNFSGRRRRGPSLFAADAFAAKLFHEKPVSIIIPVYNGHDALVRLAATLFERTDEMHEIVFIDDASTDGRIAPLLAGFARDHANVRVVTNRENRGFSHNVNIGAALSDRDFVILNTDTEVPQKWVPRLFDFIWHAPATASVTPMSVMSLFLSIPDKEHGTFAFLEQHGTVVLDRAISRIAPRPEKCRIPCGIGFCMAISRSAWRQVGPFNEELFGRGYCEEIDWTLRAGELFGYANRFAPNLFVAHWHNGSFTEEERNALIRAHKVHLNERHPDRISGSKLEHSAPVVRELKLVAKVFRQAGITPSPRNLQQI